MPWVVGVVAVECSSLCLSLRPIGMHICMNICPPFASSLATVLRCGWGLPFPSKSILVYSCMLDLLPLIACLHCTLFASHVKSHYIASCMISILHACIIDCIAFGMFCILASCCILEPCLYTCIALLGLGCQTKHEDWECSYSKWRNTSQSSVADALDLDMIGC